MIEGSNAPVSEDEAAVGTTGAVPTARDPFDVFRAQHYSLLAVLLTRAPSAQTLQHVASLEGGSGALGAAHDALAKAARATTEREAEREYFKLFVGVGRGELVPYGSYYLTGFLQEKPLARLRQSMAELGIERAPSLVELEDHVGVLCEIMAGLIEGRFGAAEGGDGVFFREHLEPWIDRFFADLEAADAAKFFRHVGAVARAFLAIETQSLAVAA